jgi:hypothetical protein
VDEFAGSSPICPDLEHDHEDACYLKDAADAGENRDAYLRSQ